MKRYTKGKLTDVANEAKEKGAYRFPVDYKVNFHIVSFCRYCKTPIITKNLSVFDGNIICNCKRCGGRHLMKLDGLQSTKKANIIIKTSAAVIAAVAVLISFL